MTDTANPNTPVLVIVMGVSGCGKSTLAEFLAKQYQFEFLEADDFHSAINKAHMASGKPLTDDMRDPWIASLCEHLVQARSRGKSCVMAYSGLRRAHRQRFRTLGFSTLFLHMTGNKALIKQRLEARLGHFMHTDLLDSQFAAMEAALDEPDIVAVDIDRTIPEIVATACDLVDRFIRDPCVIPGSD